MKTGTYRRPLANCIPVIVYAVIYCLTFTPSWGYTASIPGFYGSVTPSLPSVAANATPRYKGVSMAGAAFQNRVEYTATRDNAVIRWWDSGQVAGNFNRLDITQQAQNVVLDWDTFNIGSDAVVTFYQQAGDWTGVGTALNRIWDANPSQIYGQLNADGKVYLVNQNGILFGPGSRVNVHSLIASALNPVDDDNLLDGILKFQAEDYAGLGDSYLAAVVSNHGEIETAATGSVFLLAPFVENAGTINAPLGQIGLAAGVAVEVTFLEGMSSLYPYVYVDDTGVNGIASNLAGGQLLADAGKVGMYGRTVNQDGLIRSITAISNNGTIELLASDRVATGAGSRTLSPITASTELVHESFSISGGDIRLGGLNVRAANAQGQAINSTSLVQAIEHHGLISAPSGSVTLAASSRVYLEGGSQIDVSGEWVECAADANLLEITLNSLELKNDYGQQDGTLQGETVYVNATAGSAIGDISAYLESGQLTAQEMATQGGDISISVSNGDIIIREDALLDFSGGGRVYADGYFNTTRLLAGNQVYDISSAPQWISYQGILNQFLVEHDPDRYGITETYSGLYFGGATPIHDYVASHIEGADAGYLYLKASGLVLDGRLDGSATAGLLQTDLTVLETTYQGFTLQVAAGTRMPRGGSLILGVEQSKGSGNLSPDHVLEEVVILSDAATLPEDFSAGDDLKAVTIGGETPYQSTETDSDGALYRTILSAETLNSAGLSDLRITSNTTVTIADGAALTLQPGGFRILEDSAAAYGTATAYVDGYDEYPATLTILARAIEQAGSITVPSGQVYLMSKDTITSASNSNNPEGRRVDLDDRIFMPADSLISTAGEQIDNSLAGSLTALEAGMLDGGDVSILDGTLVGAEVIFQAGAVLDVSAGYEVNGSDVSAGEAGSIELSGDTLVTDGSFKGYALPGESGGEISLHSSRISVQAEKETLPADFTYEDDLPAALLGQSVLTESQLADGGFTHITLIGFSEVAVAAGATLTTSDRKMTVQSEPEAMAVISPAADYYVPDASYGLAVSGYDGIVTVSPEYVGSSSITLKAGKTVTGYQVVDSAEDQNPVTIGRGATVAVGPEGTLYIEGLAVEIAGTLAAPAGSITLESTGDKGQLALLGSSRLLAAGYNLARPVASLENLGAMDYEPLTGGTISLTSQTDITVAAGAYFNLSGSTPVNRLQVDAGGNLSEQMLAGAAGSLEIEYGTTLAFDAAVDGRTYLASAEGAALSIVSNSAAEKIDTADIGLQDFLENGFEDVSLSSLIGLDFTAALDFDLKGSLVLDAPLITVSGDHTVDLHAARVVLANTEAKYDERTNFSYSNLTLDAGTLSDGAGQFTLSSAGWIDITGAIAVEGAGSVTLAAGEDIRAADEIYYNAQGRIWKGQLLASGDLTLTAARIYPTTESEFKFMVDQGGITINSPAGSGGTAGPVLSADGHLIFEAETIDHKGHLAAPMGTITFIGTGDDSRVTLHAGSTTSVAGELPVLYGQVADGYWTHTNKPRDSITSENLDDLPVEGAPEGTVSIQGDAVDVAAGALIDVSGGGSIFAYEFQPGADGLANPLSESGRYVIVPGISLPGAAVILSGTAGLPAGTYSLLPEEYAFLPGAMIVEDLGAADAVATVSATERGNPVATGFMTETGLGLQPESYNYYEIRSAAEVLGEGQFNVAEALAGSAGTVSIAGTGVVSVAPGTVRMAAQPFFSGGSFELTGPRVAIGDVPDTDDFTPGVQLDAALFEGLDLASILIQAVSADAEPSELRVYAARLEAPSIELSAGTVHLLPGALIEAVDETANLNQLVYQQQYNPDAGLGTLAPAALDSLAGTGEVGGTMRLRTSGGAVDLAFTTEGGEIAWSGAAGEFTPTQIGLDYSQPYGLAILTAEQKTVINAGSTVHATDEILFNGSPEFSGGLVYSDHSTLTLSGDAVYFVPEDYAGGQTDGLFITGAMWTRLQSFENLTLRSTSDLIFLGDFTLPEPDPGDDTYTVTENLTLDAQRIAGFDLEDGLAVVTLSAETVSLVNSGDAFSGNNTFTLDGSTYTLTDTGSLTFSASAELGIGRGDITLDGFEKVNLTSAGDLVFRGQGSLLADLSAVTEPDGAGGFIPVTDPQLTFTAPRVTASYYQDAATACETANFQVDARMAAVTVAEGPGTAGEALAPGGALSISGRQVTLAAGALIEILSGELTLSGSDGVSLESGASILARGGQRSYAIAGETFSEFLSGGIVALNSEAGIVNIAAGARVDVSNDVPASSLDDFSAADRDFLYESGALDAGQIAVYSPALESRLDGVLAGSSEAGRGGSFYLDTERISDFSGLNAQLASGGFNDTISLRSREGTVTVGSTNEELAVAARSFTLIADDGGTGRGAIDIYGNLTFSGAGDGSQVNFYAGSRISLYGSIVARGTGDGAAGGDVFLGVDDATSALEGIHLKPGSLIDVTAGDEGPGGSVTFRVPQLIYSIASKEIYDVAFFPGTPVPVEDGDRSTIRGASAVTVQAFRVYTDADLAPSGEEDTHWITQSELNTWKADAAAIMTQSGTYDIENWLLPGINNDGWETAQFSLAPEIEVRSSGNLVLKDDWDLTTWRWDGAVGTLTLRAAGDLTLQASLVDDPTYLDWTSWPSYEYPNDQIPPKDAWSYRLIAGADTAGADPLGTLSGGGAALETVTADDGFTYTNRGDLTIDNGQIVYTESGGIYFASQGNTNIGDMPAQGVYKYMVNSTLGYNLATYSGLIAGNVGQDLTIQKNGAIQSAIGDIVIRTGGDLSLELNDNYGSAIRTTGTGSPEWFWLSDWTAWETHDGGDIRLDVGGDLTSGTLVFYDPPSGSATPHLKFWDNYNYSSSTATFAAWSADFGQGIYSAPGSYGTNAYSPTAGVATMGGGSVHIQAGGDLLVQAGTFQEGDLSITARGDVDGYFQVADGQGAITAMGSIASSDPAYDVSLALFDAQVDVKAYGDADMGTLFNPTFVRTYSELYSGSPPDRYLDYSSDSAVRIAAVGGDLTLSGVFWNEGFLESNESMAYRVLPPTVELAAGQDIQLGSTYGRDFLLAPSGNGSLAIIAGGDINGLSADYQGNIQRATIRLSDLDPADVYRQPWDADNEDLVDVLTASATLDSSHADQLIYAGGDDPVKIIAGGDITEIGVYSPKQTLIDAGGDISGLYYFGNNLAAGDVSIIAAAGDINLTSATDNYILSGLIFGGPGEFLVMAGNSLYLGDTKGIQAVGNMYYPALSNEDASLGIVAGLYRDIEAANLTDLFAGLKTNGQMYSELKAAGEIAAADQVLADTEALVIDPFFDDGLRGEGNISMTESNINTYGEYADVFIVADGDVDVGLSNFDDPTATQTSSEDEGKQTGIFTSKGGDINIFSRGDLNVNESRVMTFWGGDILIWSHEGDINAGRGSTTAINVGAPTKVPNETTTVESWVTDEFGRTILVEETIVLSYKTEWEPPSVGSGIRTLTYDADGALGSDVAPEAGSGYLFAPAGTIDAGEAGISVNKLYTAAQSYANTQNIEVSGTSVGVPASTSGVNMGALAGAGALAETSKISEQTASMAAEKGEASRTLSKLMEEFTAKWLDVKVIEFEE